MPSFHKRTFRLALQVQATYYFLTALWPLVHLHSFMEVTGPKTDTWLVKTVAVLLLAITLHFFAVLYHQEQHWSVVVLAVATATALIAIDCYYSFTGVISGIYLLDAAAELALLVLWAIACTRRSNQAPSARRS